MRILSEQNVSIELFSAGSAAQMNMHGVFLHIMGDAFGSLIVIITAAVCHFVNVDALQLYLDPSLR